MAEIGILWVAVAYFSRKFRASIRFKAKPPRSGYKTAAHRPLSRRQQRALDATIHPLVPAFQTGEQPTVPRMGPSRFALESWVPFPVDPQAGTPILDQLVEPDPIDLEWLAFTGSWPVIEVDQFVGATR